MPLLVNYRVLKGVADSVMTSTTTKDNTHHQIPKGILFNSIVD